MTKYDHALANLTAEIRDLRARKRALITAEPKLRALESALPYGYLIAYKTFEYTAYMFDQPGFTAESNPELLSTIELVDEILGGAEVTSEDRPADSTRIYQLTADRICVRLVVVLTEDAPSCHKQLIGYEEATEDRLVKVHVTRPVYRFTC